MRVPAAAKVDARAHAARLRTTVEGSRSGGPLWARIEDDVWREEVARALAGATDVVAVRIPASLSPDIALHALAQAAGGIGPPLLGRSLDRSRPFSDRAAEAARWLADAGVCVVVSTASRFRLRSGEPAPFMDELDALYEVWSRARDLRSVWLASTLPPPGFRGSLFPSFEEARPVESWLEGAVSADILRLAEELVRASSGGTRCSPTAFSGALAALVSGRSPSSAGRTLDTRPATMAAVRDAVVNRGEPVAGAVALARALRVPVPRSVLRDALDDRSEALMLLDAMAWGDDEFLVPAALQRALREPSGGDPRVHDVLAEHHRSLDGAARPGDVLPGGVVHWLEKAHHLGHGGAASVAKWERLELPGPEFYWDRGRWLSIVRQDYAAAAEVYRSCRERFPDDAYSWHYEGFNLERAGLSRGQAESSYHRAIRLEPGNVWFHRRLITFYIGLGRFRAAENAMGARRRSAVERDRRRAAAVGPRRLGRRHRGQPDAPRAPASEGTAPRVEVGAPPGSHPGGAAGPCVAGDAVQRARPPPCGDRRGTLHAGRPRGAGHAERLAGRRRAARRPRAPPSCSRGSSRPVAARPAPAWRRRWPWHLPKLWPRR